MSTVCHTTDEETILGNTIVGVGSKGNTEALTVLVVAVLMVGVRIVGAMLAFLFKEEKSNSAWRSKQIVGSTSLGTSLVGITESASVHAVIQRESKSIPKWMIEDWVDSN